MKLVKARTPKVETTPGGFRFYDGKPSVTTVLGRIYGVHGWLGPNYNEDLVDPVMAAYRTRGKFVHKACSLHAEGRLNWPKLDRGIGPFVTAFDEWQKASGMKFVATEVPVVSVEYGYGGRLDFVYEQPKIGWVIDLKVGAVGSNPFVGMQVEAYRRATLNTWGSCLQRGVLWLTPQEDGSVRWRFERLTDPTDWRDFVFALGAYRAAVLRGYIKEA